MEVREFRQSPFCWQDKPILRHINNNVQRKQLSSVRNVYLTLTEIASDYSSEDIKVFIFDVSNRSWLSEDTVSKCLHILQELWIIDYWEQKRNSEWKYDKKEIRLISANLTVPKFQRSSKEVPKKFGGQTSGYIEYNKEVNIESNNEDNNNSTCKVKDNNKDVCSIKDNNKELDTYSTCSIKKEERKKKKDEIENRDEVFDNLWVWYCNQNTKKQTEMDPARTWFNKLIKTNYDLNLLRYALPRYIKSVNDKTFIVLLRTYLSKKLYLDYKTEFDNLNKQEEVKVEPKEELRDDNTKLYKKNYDTSLDNIDSSQLKDDDIKIKYKRTYDNN